MKITAEEVGKFEGARVACVHDDDGHHVTHPTIYDDKEFDAFLEGLKRGVTSVEALEKKK